MRAQSAASIIPPQNADDHILIVGATQSGKSTLAAQLALPSLDNRSLLLIDPHNSLLQTLLSGDALNAFEDRAIFPLLPGRPYVPAWNLLQPLNNETPQDCAQRFTETAVDVFFHGNLIEAQRFQEHTFYAAWALAAAGWTAAEIDPFLTSSPFRAHLYPKLAPYPDLQRWIKRFNRLSNARRADLTASTLSRMRLFRLGETALIFGQRRSTLNLERFLQLPKALFLASLSTNLLHQSGAYLAAALLLASVDALLARRQKDGFHFKLRILADEFQRYPTAALERLLAERRGYGASLTLITQGLSQLSPSQRAVLLNNIGPLAAFRLAAAETDLLAAELFYPSPLLPRQQRSSGDSDLYPRREALAWYADQLKKLPPRHFYLRLPRQQARLTQSPPFPQNQPALSNAHRRLSERLQALGRPRRQVAADLAARAQQFHQGTFEQRPRNRWSA